MSTAPTEDTPTGYFRKYVQCIVDAHGEAASANGLEKVWASEYKQQFQDILNQSKECETKDTEDEFRQYVKNISINFVKYQNHFEKLINDFYSHTKFRCVGDYQGKFFALLFEYGDYLREHNKMHVIDAANVIIDAKCNSS